MQNNHTCSEHCILCYCKVTAMDEWHNATGTSNRIPIGNSNLTTILIFRTSERVRNIMPVRKTKVFSFNYSFNYSWQSGTIEGEYNVFHGKNLSLLTVTNMVCIYYILIFEFRWSIFVESKRSGSDITPRQIFKVSITLTETENEPIALQVEMSCDWLARETSTRISPGWRNAGILGLLLCNSFFGSVLHRQFLFNVYHFNAIYGFSMLWGICSWKMGIAIRKFELS